MSTESGSLGGEEIRADASPRCIACNGEGRVIHSAQRDRLFGAWGGWDLKQCNNGKCGLVWLDPMPLAREIGKAYKGYYTHLTGVKTSIPSPIKRIYESIRLGYLGRNYHYPSGNVSRLGKIAAGLLYLLPGRRGSIDESVRFLTAKPGGRLLDVGCGSGEWLASMRDLGWMADGVEFDKVAAGIARQKGLKVGDGSIEDQEFPGESFDAITLNHVIEHVSDPAVTLAECARLLKPNGSLVVLTPNIASLGYRLFKENWRGLEPPRHLHVMSPASIHVLLAKAGFAKTRVSTRNSGYILHQSLMLWAGRVADHGRMRSGVIGRWGAGLMTMMEGVLLKFNPGIGECIVTMSERN